MIETTIQNQNVNQNGAAKTSNRTPIQQKKENAMNCRRELRTFEGGRAMPVESEFLAKPEVAQTQVNSEDLKETVRKVRFGLFGIRVTIPSLMLMICMSTSAAVAGGSAKVQVCHIPPGNPANFHTITVSENSLSAHLAHGDFAGGCFDNCDSLCDDGNPCTIDACEPGTDTCTMSLDPVDCDDGNPCTVDICDPTVGCQSAPVVCDDGDLCTIDMCSPSDGSCVAAPKDCGSFGQCQAATGDCDFPCDGVSCEPISQCHQPGTCFLSDDGTDCFPGGPLEDGTQCDDGDAGTVIDQCVAGICEGVVDCLPNAIGEPDVGYITQTTLQILWLTDQPSSSQVFYTNLVTGNSMVTPLNTDLVTFHDVTIVGLMANTHYAIRAVSRKTCGDIVTSTELRIQTGR